MSEAPRVVVLAGPNGAGKSTTASAILRGVLGVEDFVNADVIAQGLSGFNPGSVDVAAGRIMLARIKQLAAARKDFAFETTLASRTFAPWISRLVAGGYEFHLVFLWLPSPEAAIARVAERVRRGGHSVPESTIRRRYRMGLKHFFDLYQPLTTSWQIIDNQGKLAKKIAVGTGRKSPIVLDVGIWEEVLRSVVK